MAPLVAYSVLRNARLLNYPFYDAFVQCLPNVDRFYLFVEQDSDDDTEELAERLERRFPKFRVRRIHLAWDSASAIAEAQNRAAERLRAEGHRFALLNQADEFFAPDLRGFLRRAQLFRRQVGFRIVHTWRADWVEAVPVYGRFLATSERSTGDGANNEVRMHWVAGEHVMHLGSVFSPEVKYAHHSELYGDYEPHRLIAQHADDLGVVMEQFRAMTGHDRFEPNTYAFRAHERAVVEYMRAGLTEYPFDDALERLSHEHGPGS